jgi:hypothetical protein
MLRIQHQRPTRLIAQRQVEAKLHTQDLDVANSIEQQLRSQGFAVAPLAETEDLYVQYGKSETRPQDRNKDDWTQRGLSIEYEDIVSLSYLFSSY